MFPRLIHSIKISAIQQFLCIANTTDRVALPIAQVHAGADDDAGLLCRAIALQPLWLIVPVQPAPVTGHLQVFGALLAVRIEVINKGKMRGS